MNERHDHHHHHDHAPRRSTERHCDVVVLGIDADGLATSTEIARVGHSVIALDPAAAPTAPASLQAERDAARRHGCEILAGPVTSVTAEGDRVRVTTDDDRTFVGRHLVDTTGSGTSVARPLDDVLDTLATAAPSGNQADWEHRYGGERIWSGNPNGSLVAEVGSLTPGTALDVGAGEGGDALWLAEQGWTVTASDISQAALAGIGAEATRRGLDVTVLHADANRPAAFGDARFDLVCASYASIPHTPDDRAIANIVGAVDVGGTLVVISHDMSGLGDGDVTARGFDPGAYVSVADIAAAVASSDDWEVEVHESRPRPPGAASASHHADDVILRAHRLA